MRQQQRLRRWPVIFDGTSRKTKRMRKALRRSTSAHDETKPTAAAEAPAAALPPALAAAATAMDDTV